MSSLLWDHENRPGDAGFIGETRYSVFYRTRPDGERYYVPIKRGTDWRTALRDARDEFDGDAYAFEIEYHHVPHVGVAI
jgi:hypothetical protein